MAPKDTTLVRHLESLISGLFSFYVRAHAAHWNVEGPMFVSMHSFFGSLYEDVHGSIDGFAEAIRQHGEYAPVSLADIVAFGGYPAPSIDCADPKDLLTDLLRMNAATLDRLADVDVAARDSDDAGLSNFAGERIGAHFKWGWQMRALLRGM
jgi:starvation-inducible DNA-binding protein